MESAATKFAERNAVILNADLEEKELGKEVSAVELQSTNVSVTTEADYANAGEITREIKKMQKKVEEYWEPMRLSTKKAYDDVLAHKKEMLTPLQKAEQILKRKMSDYYIEQERKRREQEEAMRRAAQAEADRKLEEAIAANNSGDEAAAEYAMAEAEVLDDVARAGAIQKQAPKAEGVSASKSWEITSIDSSLVPIELNGMELRPVDEKLVMQLIKTSKGKIKIPGVTYKETATISIRT